MECGRIRFNQSDTHMHERCDVISGVRLDLQQGLVLTTTEQALGIGTNLVKLYTLSPHQSEENGPKGSRYFHQAKKKKKRWCN